MDDLCFAWENRAAFMCLIANRYNVIELYTFQVIQMLGFVIGNIDASLGPLLSQLWGQALLVPHLLNALQ
ncbi:MAG: hypothetical protein A2Y07_08115 [Planctomycetes bacterium GWF2_50_10]|nr:MAG: hypothetical protein A2Y07_08115 [Planctomycetes bacterium GWF2_50_10]